MRYIRKYFGPDPKVFQTSNKGFVPLPIIVRKLLRHLTPPELRVLVYLQTRASKYGLCFPTLEEIVYELGLSGRKNLTPRLKSLEEKKLIATRTAEGKKFFLVLDPRVAIEHLAATGKLGSGQLDEINQLYEDPQAATHRTAQEIRSRWVTARVPATEQAGAPRAGTDGSTSVPFPDGRAGTGLAHSLAGLLRVNSIF